MDENSAHTDGEADVQALIEFLRERNAWCPACRYNLRGLTTPRCPECGRELRLSVGVTEPFLRAWILLAVSTFASAGLGFLFAWLLLREGYPPDRGALRLDIFYFILMVPTAFLVLATRRRFLRLSSSVQWRIAGFAAIMDIIAFIVLISTIR